MVASYPSWDHAAKLSLVRSLYAKTRSSALSGMANWMSQALKSVVQALMAAMAFALQSSNLL